MTSNALTDAHDWLGHYDRDRDRYLFEHVDDLSMLWHGRQMHVTGSIVEDIAGIRADHVTVENIAEWRHNLGRDAEHKRAIVLISGKAMFRVALSQMTLDKLDHVEKCKSVNLMFYAFGQVEQSVVLKSGNLGLRALGIDDRHVTMARGYVEMHTGRAFANFMARLHKRPRLNDDSEPKDIPF